MKQNQKRVEFQTSCKHAEGKNDLGGLRHPSEVVHGSHSAEPRSGIGKACQHGGKARQKVDVPAKKHARAQKQHEHVGNEEDSAAGDDLFRKRPVLKLDGVHPARMQHGEELAAPFPEP